MDLARDVCSSTLRLRKAHQQRVRQPLPALTVAVPDAASLRPYASLIADEVNVKHVELTEAVADIASFQLDVVPAAIGPRLGARTQDVIRAVKRGEWRRDGDTIVVGDEVLQPGEYALKLVTADGAASTALSSGDGVVLLDTTVSAELAAEGVTRDLIRLVQQTRREAGLHVSDRIELTLGVPEQVRRSVVAHLALLQEATLAVVVRWDSSDPTAELDGEPVFIGVRAVPAGS
jgi:isoleucyl-tRNA synthetase